jgi:protein-S-isoprenylcysteine O-methyltransferase Ste14
MGTLFVATKALFLAACFLVFWAWVALSLRGFDRRLDITLPGWTEPVGIFFLVAGGLLGLSCVLTFIVRGQGTPAPFDPPKEFVAVGPYRYVRNPMYLGGWLLLVGLSLYQHSVSILVFSFLWAAVAHLLLVRLEEPGLRRRFGASFDEYCRSVPRWLPRC